MNLFIKVDMENKAPQYFEVKSGVTFAYDNCTEEFNEQYNESLLNDINKGRMELVQSNLITVPESWVDLVVNATRWTLVRMDIKKHIS